MQKRQRWIRTIGAIFLSLAASMPLVYAQDLQWRTAISTIAPPKYAPGFSRFDYVNPAVTKGGTLQIGSNNDTFDSFNFLLAKGEMADGLGNVFETLMVQSQDEISSSYGLLAEAVAYPDDISSATYRLRAEARWADGTPVTPEDVVFSFEKSKELNPQLQFYYTHVMKAEKTGERDVTFTFAEKNNRELPVSVGQLTIVPRHWWEGTDANGNRRDITRTTLEPPMGSGPYRIADMKPGATIRYERRPDYWGANLNVKVGHDNFDTLVYNFFSDRDVMFQSFRAGNIDYWWENAAKRWATAYDFPAIRDGRIKREELLNESASRGVMVGFVPNMRREKFSDPRVREALNYAFDFEALNHRLFYDLYKRIDSFFFGTELAAQGLPTGQELDILDSVRDKVPPSVFTKAYTNPVGGDQNRMRNNLRTAMDLFAQAGYEMRNGRMTNTRTGEPFGFEILLPSNIIERVALPYAQNLKSIGVAVTVRIVDASQYTNRWRARDYDMLYNAWAQSLNPGNEQAEYFGSAAADREGSANYSGIKDAGVDALIQKVIFAKDRDDLIASVKALDRVLLAHHIIVPSYASQASRIAYWTRIARPQDLPKYGLGFPELWWSADAQK
ncbi:ABC transporter substrate-binding protein [Rhizobium sp. CFBP 8762]|nr:ABC transporter substrate-binding protein [Rhizobium sp. CFBP 8762]